MPHILHNPPTLESVYAAWQSLDTIGEHADPIQPLLAQATHLSGASQATLLLLDDRHALIPAATIGYPVGQSLPSPLSEALLSCLAPRLQPLVWPGSDVPPALCDALAHAQIGALLGVPLRIHGQIVGVLCLAREKAAPPFGQPELWATTLLAERLGGMMTQGRLRQQLDSQQRFINRIVENIPSSLVVIDRNLRIVSANRNFLEKARRAADTTVGSHVKDVFPRVLIAYTGMDQKIRDIFRTGKLIDGGKLSYRAPGLPTRVYYYRLVPLKVDQVVQHVMLLMDDITEREQLGAEVRRIERRLASVVECANDLVVSLDQHGRVVTWNRAAERVSGFSAEQVRGRPLVALCPPSQRLAMAKLLRSSLAPAPAPLVEQAVQQRGSPWLRQREGVQHAEIDLLTAEEQEVGIAWSCSPMLDDAGRVMGIVVLGRDLTERQSMEAKLAQSSKMASLGVMAGGIAHELRNPLGIISSSAQLLDEHAHDPDLREQCVRKIWSATRRASLIIENLLKFARPHAERMRAVALHTLLDDILPMVQHQLALQGVELVHQVAPDPPMVYGNPELLQQVFTNLILNACNAMPEGGILTVVTRTDEAGQAQICFTDTGCGIAPEHLPKIFDPFFTTMPVGKGTGLGLSISYSIVQQHRGIIEVASQPNVGTTFTITLPCAPQLVREVAARLPGTIAHKDQAAHELLV